MDQGQAIVSQRNRKKFADRGFEYVKDKASRCGTLYYWRCERKNYRCKARLVTDFEATRVTERKGSHNHDCDPAKVEVDKVVTDVKRRAVDTQEGTGQVLNECTAEMTLAARGRLPRLDALKKTVQRVRNEAEAAPAQPATLDQLVIPHAYTIYTVAPGQDENFLLYDSGAGRDRILIFGRAANVHMLEQSRTWLIDGTFSITPPLFSQVYTVMADRLGGIHPALYALLTNKSRPTYDRMFAAIKEVCPLAQPQSVSSDYEVAAFQAVTAAYPNAQLFGCLFHLTKNLKKAVQREGLRERYSTDPDFARQARMVSALAFVPIADLDEVFEALFDYLPAELRPVAEYFEKNYMGEMNRRGNGRRQPVFPPHMWSVYERVLNGQDRTNNHAEAAHRRIQCELSMSHPTLWKFIDGLRRVQKGRDTYYEALVRGEQPPLKLKKFRLADERILKIVRDYANRDPLEYLRGVAANFEMKA